MESLKELGSGDIFFHCGIDIFLIPYSKV